MMHMRYKPIGTILPNCRNRQKYLNNQPNNKFTTDQMIMILDSIVLLSIRQGLIQQISYLHMNNIKTPINSKKHHKDNKLMILLKELMILLRDNNKYRLLFFKHSRLSIMHPTLKSLNTYHRFHFRDLLQVHNFHNNRFLNFLISNHNLQMFNINKDHKYINSMI